VQVNIVGPPMVMLRHNMHRNIRHFNCCVLNVKCVDICQLTTNHKLHKLCKVEKLCDFECTIYKFLTIKSFSLEFNWRNSSQVTETDGSLPCLQDLATRPYPGSKQFCPRSPNRFKIHFNNIIQPTQMFPLITRPVTKDMHVTVMTCFKQSSDRIIEGSVGK
jgi:hypothetical protein